MQYEISLVPAAILHQTARASLQTRKAKSTFTKIDERGSISFFWSSRLGPHVITLFCFELVHVASYQYEPDNMYLHDFARASEGFINSCAICSLSLKNN